MTSIVSVTMVAFSFSIFQGVMLLIGVCKGTSEYEVMDIYSRIEYGIYFDSFYWSVSVNNVLSCAKFCIYSAMCRSFCFVPEDRKCTLNHVTVTSQPHHFTSKSGSMYSEVEKWPTSIAGPCFFRGCANSALCIPHPNSLVDYSCVVIGCAFPPTIANTTRDHDAVLLPFNTVVTYSCESQFYWSSGSPRITCLYNGQWTKTDFRCRGCSDVIPTVKYSQIAAVITDPVSVVTYECTCPLLYGDSMVGAGHIQCTDSGQWTAIDFYCKVDCFDNPRRYAGKWNITESGMVCQEWRLHTPQLHLYHSPLMFPEDGSDETAKNYCRDPGDDGILWCYKAMSGDPRWEVCDIPECSSC